jgi:integrase
MSGHIDDRWYRAGTRAKSASYGRGLRWRVRYVDPGGSERSKSFALKDDAETFLTEVKASLLQGNYVNPARGKMTLRAYSAQWLTAQTFEATTRERVDQRLRVHILPGLGGKTLSQLAQSPSTIQAWLRGLHGPDDRPLAAGHVQTILANLSAILGAAVDDGRIIRNPCSVKSVKAPRIVRATLVPWTAAEISAVKAGLPERYRVLADAAAMLGLRQGEAFGLSPDDIEFMKRVVHVKRQVRIVGSKLYFAPPKGGRERDVPLSDLASLRLSAHLRQFPAVEVTLPWKEPGGKPVRVRLIATTTARNALDRAYFHRLWRAARAKAGKANERENGFHALRHFYASAQLAGGTDIKALSEYLGHHDPGFTLRVYAHLMHGAAGRARKAIDEAFAEPSNGPQTAPLTGS